ncbi:MAG: hypothetical protein AAF267_06475 [Deinococcota bacterium]
MAHLSALFLAATLGLPGGLEMSRMLVLALAEYSPLYTLPEHLLAHHNSSPTSSIH